MREIRTYGSEGGEAQANEPFLPLSNNIVYTTVYIYNLKPNNS